MNVRRLIALLFAAGGLLALTASPALAADAGAKPNILVIMGDDIGMWNIGAHHRGLMAGRTPNLDKIAAEGTIFTDYYAEASCTAGARTSSPANCRSAPV
jgi:arylsulfatase